MLPIKRKFSKRKSKSLIFVTKRRFQMSGVIYIVLKDKSHRESTNNESRFINNIKHSTKKQMTRPKDLS